MATEAQILARNPSFLLYIFYFLLSSLYTCREFSTNSPLFMQNKPNSQNDKMNANSVTTKDCEDIYPRRTRKNKPNSKPIQTQLSPKQSQNKPNMNPNQTQNEPNQTQLQTGHLSCSAQQKKCKAAIWTHGKRNYIGSFTDERQAAKGYCEKTTKSGRPDSNRRHSAWEADILPLNYARKATQLNHPPAY